jgi:hypothetical protein
MSCLSNSFYLLPGQGSDVLMDSSEIKLVDTKKVNEFIADIDLFVAEIARLLETIQTQTRILGASYLDEHYAVLNKNIQAALKNLQTFLEQQKRITPEMRRKLEDISAYQRMGDQL